MKLAAAIIAILISVKAHAVMSKKEMKVAADQQMKVSKAELSKLRLGMRVEMVQKLLKANGAKMYGASQLEKLDRNEELYMWQIDGQNKFLKFREGRLVQLP